MSHYANEVRWNVEILLAGQHSGAVRQTCNLFSFLHERMAILCGDAVAPLVWKLSACVRRPQAVWFAAADGHTPPHGMKLVCDISAVSKAMVLTAT